MMYLKLRFGLLPLTSNYGILRNIYHYMHFILITTALLLIYINYEFIHEQERMKQEVQVVMKEYSDKIAAAKKDSNFVLLQDPLISAPICAMINKFDNPISTKPVKPIVKHVIHKKRNR